MVGTARYFVFHFHWSGDPKARPRPLPTEARTKTDVNSDVTRRAADGGDYPRTEDKNINVGDEEIKLTEESQGSETKEQRPEKPQRASRATQNQMRKEGG